MSTSPRFLACLTSPLVAAILLGPALHAQRAAQPAAAGGVYTAPVAQEFDRLHFRSIGPAIMSGRVADLAVFDANPAIYYVGTAHGGVWKTTNNGTTFTPLFQDQGLIAIGDVTISQTNPDLLWVGTGESNNRQSTSWGGGIYKSTDGGRTFSMMGLPNSRHINRILIHPRNDDIVLVAATGPLFGPGGDRGVYRTTDGGRNWTRVLHVDDETGANDIVMSPGNPDVLFASTYQRRRTTCCMNGGGPGSALWKSVDGGLTWTKISGNGFPGGPLGRIAMDVSRTNNNIVYATVEGPRPGAVPVAEGDERAATPQPPAVSTGLYRSDDGGVNWRRVSTANPRPMYFSQVRVDPVDPERVYMGGVGLHLSLDGGRTFETDAALVTHDDVHAIWINPANPDHVLIGNDGGLAVSYDLSRTWQFIPNLPVGLFYHVSFDMDFPYNVCGGMQDNYNWCGPSASRMSRGIFNHDWHHILGGDGFVAIPDLRDSRIVYTESQDGNIVRRNKVTGESKSIRPTVQNVSNATPGEAYRFHWDTPLMFSPHDPGVLLAAANRVFRSRDRGDSWEAISPDLTKNESRDNIVTMGLRGSEISISRNDGISQWPTVVNFAESPKQRGVFYAGTDDGTVSMSVDDGKTWTNITSRLPGFPSGYAYVAEVVPSRFDAATAYVAVNNYRQNDYEPYVWITTNNGASFRPITQGLRGEVVRTLTEDTRNRDVLYAGTETGIFLTLDRGSTWRRLKGRNFPTVRVDELTIHPRDNALLVATHGRALWILDRLEPIQEYAAAQRADATLFTPGLTLQWKGKDDRNEEFWGHQFFTGENPPTDAVLQVHFRKPAATPLLRISDAGGRVVRELAIPAARNQPGIQTVCWDQRVEPLRAITPVTLPAGAEMPGAGRGGRAGGAAAAPGGRGAGAGATPARPIPGYPVPLPSAGHMPENPCAVPGGPGGGGGFGGGGGANAGPHVPPGDYTVALVTDGKVVATKPLTIVMDPEVSLTGDARTRYHARIMALHEAQREGTDVANRLNALYADLLRLAPGVDSSSAPDAVKSQFSDLRRSLDGVRVKFGVPVVAGAAAVGGPGGGRGGAAAAGAAANTLLRLGAVKAAMQNVWEEPSAAVTTQANEATAALASAVAEANALLGRARELSTQLARHNLTLTLPRSPD
jgi:photosystem II stability/assembly factor-like uncharacterized protein